MDKLGVKQTGTDIIKSILQSSNFIRIFLIDIIFLSFIIVWYEREFNLFLMLTVIFLACVFVITPEYYREIMVFTIAFPIVEIICIFFGVWKYTVTSILLIPIWLFPAWGQAVFTVIIAHRGIQKRLYKNFTAHIIDFSEETKIEGKKYPGVILLEDNDKPYVKDLLKETKNDESNSSG